MPAFSFPGWATPWPKSTLELQEAVGVGAETLKGTRGRANEKAGQEMLFWGKRGRGREGEAALTASIWKANFLSRPWCLPNTALKGSTQLLDQGYRAEGLKRLGVGLGQSYECKGRARSSDSPFAYPSSQAFLTQQRKVVQNSNSSPNSSPTLGEMAGLMSRLRATPSRTPATLPWSKPYMGST